tara:strand:- start:949 stop:1308 length:360 start_codon:yes stop_codon:yes gene_type:complete
MRLTEKMEEYFIPFLQRNVQFVCDTKVVKKGKLLLFSMKGFYLTFTITNDKGIPKVFEMPYPFEISHGKDEVDIKLFLNYEILTLAKENAYARVKITNVTPIKKSKFYDRVVTFEIMPD